MKECEECKEVLRASNGVNRRLEAEKKSTRMTEQENAFSRAQMRSSSVSVPV